MFLNFKKCSSEMALFRNLWQTFFWITQKLLSFSKFWIQSFDQLIFLYHLEPLCFKLLSTHFLLMKHNVLCFVCFVIAKNWDLFTKMNQCYFLGHSFNPKRYSTILSWRFLIIFVLFQMNDCNKWQKCLFIYFQKLKLLSFEIAQTEALKK